MISLKYKKICTVVNPDSDQAKSLSMNIANEYSDHSWQIIENFDFSNVEKMDLVIAIGGDGTLLRAVSLSLKFDVPVLGINMGTVGFMTEIEGENAIDELNFYLTETVRTEVRSLLEVELNFKKDPVVYKALNDIVIARGSSVSMIETITEIDGVHLATYRGDGIVVTTATGSHYGDRFYRLLLGIRRSCNRSKIKRLLY